MIPTQLILKSTLSNYNSQWATEALKGGCKWIHLCIEEATDEEITPLAKQLLAQCHEQSATLVIEDRPELVKNLQADGVFLNQLDKPANEVRELMGHEYIIGAKATTFEEVKALKRLSVDYVVCSPTPKDCQTSETTLDFFRNLEAQINKEEVRLPICAQGVSSPNEVMPLIETGVQGIIVDCAQFPLSHLAESIQAYLNADCEE